MSDDRRIEQRMLDSFDNKVADPYPLEKYEVIGKRGVRRTDGIEKATGAARYTIDVQLPGMLFARFLTSPYPHAEIASMDTSAAEKMPGVRCILRYDDPELARGRGRQRARAEQRSCPFPAVAHFQGEECGAFVVADSEEIAENALKLIKVEWEQRPFLLDVEKAIEPGAPLTHPRRVPRLQHVHGLQRRPRRRGEGLRRGRQDHRVQVDLRATTPGSAPSGPAGCGAGTATSPRSGSSSSGPTSPSGPSPPGSAASP